MNQGMHDGWNRLVELPADHRPAPPWQVERRHTANSIGMFLERTPWSLPDAQSVRQRRRGTFQPFKQPLQPLRNLSLLNRLFFRNKTQQLGLRLAGCFPNVDRFYQVWVRGNVLPPIGGGRLRVPLGIALQIIAPSVVCA